MWMSNGDRMLKQIEIFDTNNVLLLYCHLYNIYPIIIIQIILTLVAVTYAFLCLHNATFLLYKS